MFYGWMKWPLNLQWNKPEKRLLETINKTQWVELSYVNWNTQQVKISFPKCSDTVENGKADEEAQHRSHSRPHLGNCTSLFISLFYHKSTCTYACVVFGQEFSQMSHPSLSLSWCNSFYQQMDLIGSNVTVKDQTHPERLPKEKTVNTQKASDSNQ